MTTLAYARRRLFEISQSYAQTTEYRKADGNVRHKCFISYHGDDADEALDFVSAFEEVFIPRCLGISEDEPWISSDNVDYVMDKIREKYLTDSTVTIVLVGKCTWSRKFIDWEVYSSLRSGKINRINGLLAVQLPSAAGSGTLPARVSDNVVRNTNKTDIGYARYYVYPSSKSVLTKWVEDAFEARTTRKDLINNKRDRRERNSPCS